MFTAITVMLLLIAINYFHATHKCNMFTAITVMLLLIAINYFHATHNVTCVLNSCKM